MLLDQYGDREFFRSFTSATSALTDWDNNKRMSINKKASPEATEASDMSFDIDSMYITVINIIIAQSRKLLTQSLSVDITLSDSWGGGVSWRMGGQY